MNPYLRIYLIGSFIGIFMELIYKEITNDVHHCQKDLTLKCLLSMTIFNIYGYGLLLYYIFRNFFKKFNLLTQFLMLICFISIFECVAGQISRVYNQRQTWKYDDGGVLCGGYVSVKTSILFAVIFILISHFMFD